MSLNRYISHPILGNRDDFAEYFYTVDKKVEVDAENYILSIKHNINEPNLETLIQNGKAVLVTNVSNSSYFTQSFVSKELDKVELFKIRKDLIRGDFNLYLDFNICVNENLKYKNSNANPVFSSYKSFELTKGDIIGIANSAKVPFDPKYKLSESLNSWIKFPPPSGSSIANTKLDFDENGVTVTLNEVNYKLFENANQNKIQSLYGLLLFPFVMASINFIITSDYEIDEFPWVKFLRAKALDFELGLIDKNFDQCYVTALAENLIKDPINMSLEEMNNLKDKDNSDK